MPVGRSSPRTVQAMSLKKRQRHTIERVDRDRGHGAPVERDGAED